MKRQITYFFSITVLTIIYSCNCLSQSPITLKTLLSEMTDFESVARWPAIPYTSKQASSYDRRSISPTQPGWFANGDFNQFIRSEQKSGHTEEVMMDAAGPGAITRFWLTTLVKQGTLRFYFDNEERPTITIPAYDLMKGGFDIGPGLLIPHSSYDASGKGGNTLYLPLPYQKHCKITWENTDTSTIRKPHYYQINYRTYPEITPVTTFRRSDLNALKKFISETENKLLHPSLFVSGKKKNIHRTISPATEIAVELPAGPAAIHELVIKLSTSDSTSYEKAWRSLILKIEFDDKQTVSCPLGDFAGSGYGGRPIKSWYREVAKLGAVTARWVMPYQKKARIMLVNESEFPVEIDLLAKTADWRWDQRSMYFHTSYKYEKNVKDAKWDYDVTKIAAQDSVAPIEWNFLDVNAKGLYLGNTLAIFNNMQTWYGEGDAKAWVDNEKFPSEFGTGLEDYYNTSWAPVVLYQTPFANAPRADNVSSFGHNTFTRTRNLDAIPFQSHFKYDLEMLSWDGGTIDIAATTYWYELSEDKKQK